MTSRSDDIGAPRPKPKWERRPHGEPTAAEWSARADLAESAIVGRHLRPLWCLPATDLGVVGWPATRRERWFIDWHYWWQAHLIDCAVDAAVRVPTPVRRSRIAAIVRAHRIRNITGWTNKYYDDMAWLAIALERAERTTVKSAERTTVKRPQRRTTGTAGVRKALVSLERELYQAWVPEQGGGIPWRVESDFFNTPANGPAAIALARLGRHRRAAEMADWIDTTLRDPDTGLIFDGIHLPSEEIEHVVHSYCQGVVLGADTELAVHTGEQKYLDRVHRLLGAVSEHLTDDLVISGRGGGGDGGLFDGILARNLASVALRLPGSEHRPAGDRRIAAAIVRASATAAWSNRLEVEGEPLFGHDWTRPARLPGGSAGAGRFTENGSVTSSAVPERDLSVQLSGWMLMEAAYQVSAAEL